ncbi:MAG: transcriptional regulator [Proteobacteria bacterium]|nr:transcriptional regulator [Pseudomonadota bacterium]MBU1711134.1 transcriptional regulator [Pseudomonadota bacterium]
MIGHENYSTENYIGMCEGIKNLVNENQCQPDDDLLELMISRVWTGKIIREESKDFPDPIDLLKRIMEEQGLTNQDLCPYIGNNSRVCDVLHRRRPLSLKMIRNLNRELGIPAEILIQPY